MPMPMPNNLHPTTLPIVHAALCAAARTAVLVASPVRYDRRPGTVSEIGETDLVVTLVGALGTHYMIWRESPNDRRLPATMLHHVQPARMGYLASTLLTECGVPRALLIDDFSLAQLLVERAAEIGTPSGALAFHLETTITAACRTALSVMTPTSTPSRAVV